MFTRNSITVACVGSAPTDPVIDIGTIGPQYAIDRLIRKLSANAADEPRGTGSGPAKR